MPQTNTPLKELEYFTNAYKISSLSNLINKTSIGIMNVPKDDLISQSSFRQSGFKTIGQSRSWFNGSAESEEYDPNCRREIQIKLKNTKKATSQSTFLITVEMVLKNRKKESNGRKKMQSNQVLIENFDLSQKEYLISVPLQLSKLEINKKEVMSFTLSIVKLKKDQSKKEKLRAGFDFNFSDQIQTVEFDFEQRNLLVIKEIKLEVSLKTTKLATQSKITPFQIKNHLK